MRGLDIILVRFIPILLSIFIGINIYDSWNGEFTYFSMFFHSNSVVYASALFLISLSNKKYHCVWNRAMYVELIIFPLINYLDAKFNLIPDVVLYLKAITSLYIISLVITAYLGINHFIKKRRNRYKEYKLK